MTPIVPSRKALALFWVGMFVLLSGLMLMSRLLRTGGDDPDPARQRPGILDAGSLPEPAPLLQPDVPDDGLPALIFFAGRGTAAELCDEISSIRAHVRDAQVVVVAPEPVECPDFVKVVDDLPVERAARQYGLPVPIDRGEPAGYVVVDAEGRIRYRTLDPSLVGLLDEAVVVLGALR